MSTSHYSRPAQNDVGADTIRIPLSETQNVRRHTKLVATIWLVIGVILLLADGTAMYHFANDALEASIIAILSMPTGVLVILAALEARK
jgi:hypothetical protein